MRKGVKFYLILSVFLMFSMGIFKGSQLQEALVEFKVNKADLPLLIDGNVALNVTATFGSGIEGDPYVLENYSIDLTATSDHGIVIQNTDAYFILRNCTVVNGESGYWGIRLLNVSHAQITNNTVNHNSNGIYLKR